MDGWEARLRERESETRQGFCFRGGSPVNQVMKHSLSACANTWPPLQRAGGQRYTALNLTFNFDHQLEHVRSVVVGHGFFYFFLNGILGLHRSWLRPPAPAASRPPVHAADTAHED